MTHGVLCPSSGVHNGGLTRRMVVVDCQRLSVFDVAFSSVGKGVRHPQVVSGILRDTCGSAGRVSRDPRREARRVLVPPRVQALLSLGSGADGGVPPPSPPRPQDARAVQEQPSKRSGDLPLISHLQPPIGPPSLRGAQRF